jgi:hypothetical protein
MITATERQQYVQRRLNQILWWNRLGWLVLIAIAALGLWIYQQMPLYFDPAEVVALARSDRLPSAELVQLAALGNLAFWGCLALMAGLVLYAYIAAYNERQVILTLTQPINDEDHASPSSSTSAE